MTFRQLLQCSVCVSFPELPSVALFIVVQWDDVWESHDCCNDLPQTWWSQTHPFIILHSWRSESWNASHGAELRMSAVLCFSLEALVADLFPYLSHLMEAPAVLGTWSFHLQSQQWLVESFHCITLTSLPLLPSSTFKDPAVTLRFLHNPDPLPILMSADWPPQFYQLNFLL